MRIQLINKRWYVLDGTKVLGAFTNKDKAEEYRRLLTRMKYRRLDHITTEKISGKNRN